MSNNTFDATVESLLKGMNGVVSSKTVVGEAIHIGDAILLPLVDVSFAIGAGAFQSATRDGKKDQGAGGLGGKVTPSSVLVIQNGHVRLVNIKNQDTITKLMDLIPDVMDRFGKKSEETVSESDIDDFLNKAE